MTTRRLFTSAQIDAQCKRQGHACAYCMLPFGTVVSYRGETVQTPTGDHAVPWSLSGETQAWNLVVCCQICNGFKSSRVFTNLEEARRELLVKRMQRHVYSLMVPDTSLCEDPEGWSVAYAAFYADDALSDDS